MATSALKKKKKKKISDNIWIVLSKVTRMQPKQPETIMQKVIETDRKTKQM